MIRQLSVFVENKPGSLMDVTSRLTEANVNIRAVATFDTPEFGILRLVVDKPSEAKSYLTSKGFVVRIHQVIGVELEDREGNLESDVGNPGAGRNQYQLHLFICHPKWKSAGDGV